MFVTMLLEFCRTLLARRRAVRELAELTDQDLADVGLVRSQIADFGAGGFVRSAKLDDAR